MSLSCPSGTGDVFMSKKRTYEEQEQRVKELKKEVVQLQPDVKQKRPCWEFFECNEKECPAYKSKGSCWLISGTHCRKKIQGKLLEKIEECLPCEVFTANLDVDSMQETVTLISKQFTEYRTTVSTEIAQRKQAEEAMRESIHRVQVAYDQSIIYAEQLKEEIAERKWAEEALRESESRYRTLFNNASDIIFIHDLSGHTLDFNQVACERLGYSRQELLGMTPMDIDAPEYGALVPERINELRQSGHIIFETSHVTKEGKAIPTEVSTRLVEYAGKPAVLSIARDITKRKQAEEEGRTLRAQLQQTQKMESIGTLAGGIAHDFNNLLMGIQGNVSLIFLDTDTAHRHYERLKSIEKQVQSGAMLTSQLLGYARKGTYEVKPVDLNQLVRETSETFGRTRKDISIHLRLAEELSAVEADSGQIERVLWNLLVNAADAMPGGGDLNLKTENVTHEDMKAKVYEPKPGNYVVLTVTDTGIGMDKQTIDRIFDPFFTTKEMGRGTGLGLASAYGIIKAHAGYIDVESEEAIGTTFSIYLPASQKKVLKTIETVETAERFIKEIGTILFVDDEEVIREIGKDLLEAMGYRVLTADSGERAVEVYRKRRDVIDIVILDMVMPTTSGGEAYDRMKEINPDIKVLLSSGYSVDSQAKEILARGCDAFIQKPFDMRALSQKIREVLEKE
jgi:two-component system cell cycle sensor histidine kinase/response regulator CckA